MMNEHDDGAHNPNPTTWTITVVNEELVHLNAQCLCGSDDCFWSIDTYRSGFNYWNAAT
jgi:hypothetical protein